MNKVNRNAGELAFKTVVFLMIVAVTFALVKSRLIGDMATHPVVFCLLLDCFLIHVATNASVREALATMALGTAFCVAWLAFGKSSGWSFWIVLATFGSALGLASVLVLSARALQMEGEAGQAKLRTLMRGGVFLAMAVWSIPMLQVANHLRPYRFDSYLYAFDAGFGFQPSFLAGRLFARAPLLHRMEYAIYVVLATPVALTYIGHLRQRPRKKVDILLAFVLNSCIGYALFLILPAAGPGFAFPQMYPFHEPAQSALRFRLMTIPDALPNAMPSVHVSTALLVWFNTRPWGWARWLAALFVLATLLATLGLGEHYLIDLVVAFPYALLIQSIAVTGMPRTAAAATGALLTGGWLVLLLVGHSVLPNFLLAYFAAPATVAVSLWQEGRLTRKLYAPIVLKAGKTLTSSTA